ncbi:hypothetical protein Hdeb2414_s0004g00120691 [Helianthus debilis subsp. tardiflorus]
MSTFMEFLYSKIKSGAPRTPKIDMKKTQKTHRGPPIISFHLTDLWRFRFNKRCYGVFS